MSRKLIFALAAVLTLACAAGAAARGVMPQDEFLACCARGKLSQVGKGVRRNADVNRLEATGQSPLICAAGEPGTQGDPLRETTLSALLPDAFTRRDLA